MLDRVRRRLARWRVGPGVVVAVSGGSDSVALLRILHALGPILGLDKLVVAHLNHGVRPDAADDARFVAELAGSLGLPVEVGHWAPERAGHLQADARKARYAWLEEVARRQGAATVAVGHTRDDQVETILGRIVRGTGLQGLAGMPARRPLSGAVTLVRPLLGLSRAELRAYLAEMGQPYREDFTNIDTAYTRSRLRHDLLPKLADEYNPKVDEALLRLGRLAGSARRRLDRRAGRLASAALIEAGPSAVVLAVGPLRPLSRTERAEVIRHCWRAAGWPEGAMTARRWLRLAAAIERNRKRFDAGAGIEARLSADALRLSPIAAPDFDDRARSTPLPAALTIPGAVRWGAGRITATLDRDGDCGERVDLDALRPFRATDGQPTLEVRAPRDGDRFAPLGLGGHSRPLNDFFRGRKVPRQRRIEVPLVCDAEGIVWVVGHRIAERVKITDTTRRALGLRRDEPPD